MDGLRFIFLTTSNHILTCSPVSRKVKVPDDLAVARQRYSRAFKVQAGRAGLWSVFYSYCALKGV